MHDDEDDDADADDDDGKLLFLLRKMSSGNPVSMLGRAVHLQEGITTALF